MKDSIKIVLKMNFTGFYRTAHKLLRSIKTYTERQLEEVMINVESTAAGVGYPYYLEYLTESLANIITCKQ